MNNLFKILLFVSPILAIVLYYIMIQQQQTSSEIEKQDTTFERDWNEQMSNFADTPEEKEKYLNRAAKAEEQLKEKEEEEKRRKAKAREFEEEFERAMQDPELKKLAEEIEK